MRPPLLHTVLPLRLWKMPFSKAAIPRHDRDQGNHEATIALSPEDVLQRGE